MTLLGRTAGFTLLEILVALVVLGFLMAGLAQGVHFGLAAWTMQDRLIERGGDLDAVDRLLRGLIGRMDPGTRADPPVLAGDQARFAFTSVLPSAAGGEVADIRLGTDSRRRLVLGWRAHLHGILTGPPAPEHIETLLDGIGRLELAYWAGGQWRRDWTAKAVPELVRIRIAFPAGDHRHWPDIVARPLRANREH